MSVSYHRILRYAPLFRQHSCKYGTTSSTNRAGCSRAFSSSISTTRKTLRRRRVFLSHAQEPEYEVPRNQDFGQLTEPYAPKEKTMDDYLDKTTLSPWVPLPDAVARRVFDIAQVKPTDMHVDLGSGDGRVCFHALQAGVKATVGIDVDEGIVDVAKERLAKRHPPPDNIFFLVADLLDENHKAWQYVQEATIITMFFATEALEKFRPVLERKLAGRTCQIVTCGYEMPGWRSVLQEVVLGTQIHLYRWGEEEDEEANAMDERFLFQGPDILSETPEELSKTGLKDNRFEGATIIDRTSQHPIRGFNPSHFEENQEDDNEDDNWSDFDDDEDDDDDNNNSNTEAER